MEVRNIVLGGTDDKSKKRIIIVNGWANLESATLSHIEDLKQTEIEDYEEGLEPEYEERMEAEVEYIELDNNED